MTTLITVIILIIIYIFSIYRMYRFVRIAHSKEGKWSNLDTKGIDIFITFCPIVNILFMFDNPFLKLRE